MNEIRNSAITRWTGAQNVQERELSWVQFQAVGLFETQLNAMLAGIAIDTRRQAE